MFVEPDLLCRLTFLKEQQIRPDAGVGFEHAVGQTDDCMEVALLQEMFLKPGLHPFAEQRAVRQHHSGTAARLEQAHDQREKEICRLACLKVLGKVAFDPVFFLAAEGRIGEDDVHAIGLAIADVGPSQRVVVADEGGVVDAMQQHVRHAEHVRKLLLLAGP